MLTGPGALRCAGPGRLSSPGRRGCRPARTPADGTAGRTRRPAWQRCRPRPRDRRAAPVRTPRCRPRPRRGSPTPAPRRRPGRARAPRRRSPSRAGGPGPARRAAGPAVTVSGRAPRQRAGGHRHGAEGVEELADRRAVRGHVDVQPVHRAEHVPSVDLGDLDDLGAVRHGQVDRLAGQLTQPLERGPGQLGQVAQPVVADGERREDRARRESPRSGPAAPACCAPAPAAGGTSWSGPGRSRRPGR